jgi:hypothetical protein
MSKVNTKNQLIPYAGITLYPASSPYATHTFKMDEYTFTTLPITATAIGGTSSLSIQEFNG